MCDALGFFEPGLAFSKVAKHQQTCQRVGHPSADRLKELLLLRRPGPRVRALVQPEHVRFVYLGIDGHSDDGLYAESFRELRRDRMLRSRTESDGTAGGSRGLEYIGDLRIHRQINSQSEGAGEVRPSMLHLRSPRWGLRIPGIDQPGSVAIKDRQHG